jgi:TolB protein
MTLSILAVVVVAVVLIQLVGDEGQSGGTGNSPAGGVAPTSAVRAVTVDASTLPTLPPTYTPSPTQPPPPTQTPLPTAPPLSYYILIMSARGPGQRTESIFRMAANGSGDMIQLTDDEGSDLYPVISPNGQDVLFVSDRAGSPELFTVDTSGSGSPRQLTSLGATLLESPSWSPDGEHIVFNAEFDTSPDSEIYIIARGRPNELTQLTDNQAADRDPAWSPDGSTIAFTSDRDTPDYPQIYAVPADCQETFGRCEDQVTLLERSQYASTAPAWSPDGQYIAFASNRKRIDDYDIYVMRASGSDVRLLTLDAYGGGQGNDTGPVWSPDSQWIAFMSDRIVGRFQIYVMLTDGSGARGVTSVVGDATSPVWLP